MNNNENDLAQWYVFDDRFPPFTINLRESAEEYLKSPPCRSINECVMKDCYSPACMEKIADDAAAERVHEFSCDDAVFAPSPIKKIKRSVINDINDITDTNDTNDPNDANNVVDVVDVVDVGVDVDVDDVVDVGVDSN